jgi:hypothetical protein
MSEEEPIDLLNTPELERRSTDLEVIRWLVKIHATQQRLNDTVEGHIGTEKLLVLRLDSLDATTGRLDVSVRGLLEVFPPDQESRALVKRVLDSERENQNIFRGVRIQFKRALLVALGLAAFSRVAPTFAAWVRQHL